MRIKTERFGELEADPSTFIKFGAGLYGFPEARNFLMIETSDGNEFRWLQCVEKPSLAFLVTDPTLYYPDYPAALAAEHPLIGAAQQEYQVLSVVTVERSPRRVTVNLAAPITVNVPRREGAQIILARGGYGTDHDLVKDLGRCLARAC